MNKASKVEDGGIVIGFKENIKTLFRGKNKG
jgi:ribosomal protein L30E